MISWGYVTPRVMEWGEPARTLCFLHSEFFGASLLVKVRGLVMEWGDSNTRKNTRVGTTPLLVVYERDRGDSITRGSCVCIRMHTMETPRETPTPLLVPCCETLLQGLG